MYAKETQDAQEKLENEMLRKYEEEKRLEELWAIEEAKRNMADPKAAKKPPPPAKATGKAGKEGDKPIIDVPKIEVP